MGKNATDRFSRFPVKRHMTEPELQKGVLRLARWLEWRVFHARTANTDKGFMTAVSADGAGYPDLTMVRGDRLLFVELKQDKRYPRSDQREWLQALHDVPHIEVYIWRPVDWRDGTIERLLRERPTDEADSD